jgi:nucleoside phosphorylase
LIALIFPFPAELEGYLGQDAGGLLRREGRIPCFTAPAHPETLLAVCGQGKVETALACQMLADDHAAEIFFLLGSATALDLSLAVGDAVLAETSIEWDFGEEESAGPSGRPLFHPVRRFPDGPPSLRRGAVLSGDRNVFSPAGKARLRDEYGALALAWEGAGFHRFLKRNQLPGWEIRIITETAEEGRPPWEFLRERIAAGFPALVPLIKAAHRG